MSERCLDQMDGRAMVECMGGMGVPQPVGADRFRNPGPSRRVPDDGPHTAAIERSSRPRREYRLITSSPGAKLQQVIPQLGRDGDRACPAVLPEHRDLGFVGVVLQIPPF
jgi:hypothetical protein